jgi:hypothetical protein
MRKYFFIFSLILVSENSISQYSFDKAVKLYYKVNPFDRKFSVMLNNILSDTSFVQLEMHKRTDSNFFFLSGFYKRFNPFDFKAKQTQVRLAESEITYNDLLGTNDTIIMYQVLGLTDNGEENKAIVQKELTRFHRRFSYDFWKKEYKEAETNGVVTAGIYNYYLLGYHVPPLSAAWGKMPGENRYTFTITVRLKVKENFADIPKSPEE